MSSLFLFFAAETWDVSISSGGRFKKPLPIDFKLENEKIFSKITKHKKNTLISKNALKKVYNTFCVPHADSAVFPLAHHFRTRRSFG